MSIPECRVAVEHFPKLYGFQISAAWGDFFGNNVITSVVDGPEVRSPLPGASGFGGNGIGYSRGARVLAFAVNRLQACALCAAG